MTLAFIYGLTDLCPLPTLLGLYFERHINSVDVFDESALGLLSFSIIHLLYGLIDFALSLFFPSLPI